MKDSSPHDQYEAREVDAPEESRHAVWMRVALAEAELAALHGDVPVGAVVVGADDRELGRGHNRRESDRDPTGHAEIVALRAAARGIAHWRLDGATLYSTLEPCPMCAGAAVNARIERVVFGALDPKAGALESLYRLGADPRLNHRFEVTGGILARESQELLQRFFRQLRRGEP